MGVAALSAAAYGRMLKLLLPPGRVWRLDSDSVVSDALLASGDELARVSSRAADLLTESDPRTATASELLPDFELELELEATGTEADRQARVVAWLLRRQRVRAADYQLALASILGQDAADVVVIENSRAHAIAVNDDQEIYRFFVYRDPLLAGSYDIAAAQELVDDMAHSHTQGHVIESIDLLCDDPESLCDRDRLGV